MPIKTILVYRTTVVNGRATASQLVELEVNDTNDDNSITRDEWILTTGDEAGHIGGNVGGAPALWDGTTGATNQNANGFLYTTTPIPTTAPGNLTVTKAVLDSIVHGPKYAFSIESLIICFLSGTLIATPDGERPVESLRPGDLVMTRDHGPQPLVWSGSSAMDAARLDQSPNLRPIRIAVGALGDGLPKRDLYVSAQHRILIRDGEGTEYLTAALHLLRAGMDGLSVQTDGLPFDLVHIACARHEIILAEGAATESFFTGPMAIRALNDLHKAELLAVFPDLSSGKNPMTPARPFLNPREVTALIGNPQTAAA